MRNALSRVAAGTVARLAPPPRTPAAAPTLPVQPLPPAGSDYASLLSALPIAVVVLAPDDRFHYANHAAEGLLGVSQSQLLQLRLSDLVAADSPLALLIAQVRAREVTIADHDLSIDGPRLRKHGIAVHAAPMLEEPGVVLLAMQDGSAARALDRQIAFRSAARSVTGMATVLAHEVKNPLSGIRGAAQLLEATVSEADRELAILIRDEADRIRALVDRMEVFGEKPVEHNAVNIHRVLEHVRRLAQSGFAAHLRFTEAYDPSLPPVWGNRDQLVQVLLNLVKNAAESITSGIPSGHGEITLQTAYHHGVRLAAPGSVHRHHLPLVVSVRDTGPGIPEDIRPHLFEPFVTSKPSGSGLGLALVAKIIEEHGGLIEVDSQPGRTEFRVHLPVHLEDGDTGVILPPMVRSEPAAAVGVTQPRPGAPTPPVRTAAAAWQST